MFLGAAHDLDQTAISVMSPMPGFSLSLGQCQYLAHDRNMITAMITKDITQNCSRVNMTSSFHSL